MHLLKCLPNPVSSGVQLKFPLFAELCDYLKQPKPYSVSFLDDYEAAWQHLLHQLLMLTGKLILHYNWPADLDWQASLNYVFKILLCNTL